MKDSLFKNFKTLKEKNSAESANSDGVGVQDKMDNVSVVSNSSSDTNSKKAKKAVSEKINADIDDQKNSGFPSRIELTSRVGKADPKKPVNPYAKRLDSSVVKKSFTIFLKDNSFEFLKDFVFYKVTQERLIFYNQSDALIEALDLIKGQFNNAPERPESIKQQEKMRKGGRRRNSDEIYSSTTSCYIPISYWDLIKDVTYFKVTSGDMYYKDWDLIEVGIEALRRKYNGLVVPRPDYIREEEMQRGKRSKQEG